MRDWWGAKILRESQLIVGQAGGQQEVIQRLQCVVGISRAALEGIAGVVCCRRGFEVLQEIRLARRKRQSVGGVESAGLKAATEDEAVSFALKSLAQLAGVDRKLAAIIGIKPWRVLDEADGVISVSSQDKC